MKSAERNNPEIFTWVKWQWDIDELAKLVTDDMVVHELPVAKVVGLTTTGIINVDPDHLDEVDLTKPVFSVPLPPEGAALLPVDGWHRIARAGRDGISTLPLLVFTEEQSASVRRERGF